MAKYRTKKYGVFNVVAQPHPEGIYHRVFESAVGVGVKYWSDYFAAITPLSKVRDEVFTGRLAVWMAVDPTSNVINLADFVERPLTEDDEVVLPKDRGLNSRVFQFAFNVKTHYLYLELKNDEGASISPKRAEAAFSNALGEAARELTEEFRVQIVPERDGLEKILGIERLTSLEIELHRPNPDDITDDANIVMREELDDQNVKKSTRTLKKAPGFDTIILNARNRILAAAASFNGLVRGKGRTADGKPIEKSTKDYPKIISKREEGNETEAGGIRSVAREE